MRFVRSVPLIALFIVAPPPASAQCTCPPCPLVDITLVDNGANELEVRLRPDGSFNELFSQLQFTLRWDAASGANLGTIDQQPPASVYMPLGTWGGEQDDSGYRYQIIGGLGFTTLANAGTSWSPGVEYTLMTVPVINGSSSFEIAADSWTIANNADYFVSLCGSDQTGAIYATPTGMIGTHGPAVSLEPNPSDGLSWLTMTVADAKDLRLEVTNTAGQVVWAKDLKGISGRLREAIDLKDAGAGVYMLKVDVDGSTWNRRFVVR